MYLCRICHLFLSLDLKTCSFIFSSYEYNFYKTFIYVYVGISNRITIALAKQQFLHHKVLAMLFE